MSYLKEINELLVPRHTEEADGVGPKTFESETLDRFESIFKAVNTLFT